MPPRSGFLFFQRHTPNRLVFKSMLKQFVTADVPGDNETKERWVVDRAKGYQHTLKKTEPFWLRHLVKGFALMESQDVIDINELGSQLKRNVFRCSVKLKMLIVLVYIYYYQCSSKPSRKTRNILYPKWWAHLFGSNQITNFDYIGLY